MKDHDMNVHPTDESMANEDEGQKWLPKSLALLLDTIMPSKRKRKSIGQCIVYATRPRYAIPPVLFGLGVQVDHVFGSRWLVDQLSRLGFSISHEVSRYNQSVLQTEQVEEWISTNESGFIQWSADNVDHNTVTLDGKNTFHGMGIIASTTSTGDNLVPHLEPVLNFFTVVFDSFRVEVSLKKSYQITDQYLRLMRHKHLQPIVISRGNLI